MDDFDKETIEKARKLSIIKDQNSDWKNLSNEEMLKQSLFYKRDYETGEYGFNLASILLFGKKETIASIMSWYKVDILKRINDTERYDDRFVCESNLINSFDEIQNYINNSIESPFFLDENGITFNAVGVIIREIVSNILIHRNFMESTTSKIVIMKNMIVSENPNIPKEYHTIDANNFEPFSKNVIIAKVFRKIGYADELGSGIRLINGICKKYYKSTPLFEDKDIFRTEINSISNEKILLNTISQENLVIDFIKKNGSINNEQCRKLLNVEKSRASEIFASPISKGIVHRTGKGKGTIYKL